MRRVTAGFALLLIVVITAPAAAQEVDHDWPSPPECIDWCPIIRPESPVIVERYAVETTIENQAATTRITQVLRNHNEHGVAEGYVYLPLPAGAAVTDLVLWIDGEPVPGDLLDADKARATYRDIVSTLKDPALLEWIDHQLLQLSVFPIPAGGTRTVEIEYIELLSADGGLVSYRHPLGSELSRYARIEHIAISVSVVSKPELRAIYSPSHRIDVDRTDDHQFTASYESTSVSDQDDFALFYSTSDAVLGANLLSFREGQDHGYFLLLVAPGVDVDVAVAKDIVLVLDRSGSMEGEKFEQAVEAARFVIGHLNDDDRFNIITFSSSVDSFAAGLRPASEAPEAERWLKEQAANGATDINRALLEAVEIFGDTRPSYLVFLTDGLPTRGEKQPGWIITNLVDSAPKDVALFAFGVGFDVDTVLLDTLADNHHGTSSYVVPGERIDETISGFYEKVRTLVLTGVEIDVDGPVIRDLQPNDVGDVFAGEQLAIVGRYRDGGSATIRVSGEVNGNSVSYTYTNLRFRTAGGDEFLPRLWATRKIGDLLREIRIFGPNQELIEEVIMISTRYGVVTPYTSFLVTEPVPLTREDLRRAAATQLSSGAFDRERSGEEAVTYSAAAQAFSDAAAPSPISAEASETVRVTGSRAFTLIDGVWVDTTFDPSGPEPLRVAYLSDVYLALAASRPEVASALSIAQHVIVVIDGTAYEVVSADATADAIELPAPRQDSGGASPDPSVVVSGGQIDDGDTTPETPTAQPPPIASGNGRSDNAITEPNTSTADNSRGLWRWLLAAGGSALVLALATLRTRRRKRSSIENSARDDRTREDVAG